MSFTPRIAPTTVQVALFDDNHTSTPAAPVAHTVESTGWSATYSPCTRFRYLLFRPLTRGARNRGRIMWCMMNPSTATEFKNDPTIAKCMAYSEAWGFSDIEITNTFALRSPKPMKLVEEFANGGNPVGDENDRYIIEAAKRADFIMYACGVPPFKKGAPAPLRDRPRIVFEMLRQQKAEIHALAITKDGNPYHPLYLPLSTQPIPFNGWPGSDGLIMGYTLAIPLGEKALPEDPEDGECYPYAEKEEMSTIDARYARTWPTIADALDARAKGGLFGEGEVRVVKKMKKKVAGEVIDVFETRPIVTT